MNILHLKYAVEVEKTGSITQAAERLFMSQPNLSKAIRELETTLGISLFKRSSKGIVTTQKGKEFLTYAKNILAQIEEMEELYQPDRQNIQRFSISVPRGSYIAHAFTCFVNKLDPAKSIDINFSETNSMETINKVMEGECNLGIIRYQTAHEKYFFSVLDDKGMVHKPVLEYTYLALMSKSHPLAAKPILDYYELNKYIEIMHGDLTVPFLPVSEIKKTEQSEHSKNRIYVYERGSQFDLLRKVIKTYMWVSPMPKELLECYGLVQKKCDASNHKYKDLLIFPADYRLSTLDKAFITELYRIKNEISATK
ncbi:LysR family transcriptional regulator [Desulfitobacterium sp. AusDCA]|uniref:LysR family transcriptional regulator n=1 Tax=Desulfitobacterium sp. AusDCA TaxID=3240383 RepID=UPI003DA6FAAC